MYRSPIATSPAFANPFPSRLSSQRTHLAPLHTFQVTATSLQFFPFPQQSREPLFSSSTDFSGPPLVETQRLVHILVLVVDFRPLERAGVDSQEAGEVFA